LISWFQIAVKFSGVLFSYMFPRTFINDEVHKFILHLLPSLIQTANYVYRLCDWQMLQAFSRHASQQSILLLCYPYLPYLSLQNEPESVEVSRNCQCKWFYSTVIHTGMLLSEYVLGK
jgi:hypothetical protein